MKFGNLKNLLGSVAPTIASALGGPLAGAAAQQVAKVLGVEPTPQAIEQAVQQATPEQLAEIKRAELDFEVRMKELDLDLFALEVADVQQARTAHKNDWTPKVIALIVIGFFCFFITLITLQEPSANSEAMVNLILGWLGGLSSTVVAFYFGSAHDHKQEAK
jgi:hypothetical protein